MSPRTPRTLSLTGLLLLLAACGGGGAPDKAQVEQARAQVGAAVAAADQARTALELLGILPSYTCGEPQRSYVGRAAEHVQTQVACATVHTEADETSDVLVVSFAPGCSVRGHAVQGRVAFEYSGGDERTQLAVDLRELVVDGTPLTVRAGYGTCGDAQQVFALGEGDVPRREGLRYVVDAQVQKRDGVPLLGSDTLVLDGGGRLTQEAGADALTLTALRYDLGEYLPREGTALLEQHDGRRLQVTFRERLWRLGEAEVQVDDHDPVRIPVVR